MYDLTKQSTESLINESKNTTKDVPMVVTTGGSSIAAQIRQFVIALEILSKYHLLEEFKTALGAASTQHQKKNYAKIGRENI